MAFLASFITSPLDGYAGRIVDAVAPLLRLVPTVHPPASLLAVGFAVVLVLSLVTAEEVELRRGGEPRG